MIEINNLTTSAVDKGFLKKVAQKVLKGEKKKEAGLSIVLIGQGRMRKLNKKYRRKNRVTDVLSFGKTKKFPVLPKEKVELGEVIICLSEVKKNAKKFTPLEITRAQKRSKKNKSLMGYNIAFKKELAQVLIHGILHLLGYEHEKGGEEAKRMKGRQEYYLARI